MVPSRPPTLSVDAYANVCKCRHSTFDEKLSYLNAIAACGTDGIAAEAVHGVQRTGKLRQGPPPDDAMPDEGLGVLVLETRFIQKTAASFGMSVAVFEKTYRKWMNFHAKRGRGETPTEQERLAARAFLTSTVPARQDGEIWLFRHPSKASDPYDGLLGPWLAARLGLKIDDRETRLTFGFWERDVKDVKQPRFYDPSWKYLSYWHWTGKTRPLPRTPGSPEGLEELVAAPPQLGRLSRPVERVECRQP